MRIEVTAPIRPTELPERVEQAATKWFPGEVELAEDRILVNHTDPSAFRQRVWEERIIDTMRGALLNGIRHDRVTVAISKQAAYAGRVSLPAAPHALGEVRITFHVEASDEWEDGEAFVWWLCPPTKDGKIVEPAAEE